MSHTIAARAPRSPVEAPPAAEPEAHLRDASRFPGGHAPRAWSARHEGHVAWVLGQEARVLAVGAQSSLTGGATPRGDALITTDRMDRILEHGPGRVRVEPGVALATLQTALRERGAFYPPAPTFDGALVGGTVSTNAAGAATWKYGTTRAWVEALTVVLASGDVLDVARGQVVAGPEGFLITGTDGQVARVPAPNYAMPDVPKRSAGYHAGPALDLVDLFVGSEGTLGVITEVTLRTLDPEPAVAAALVPAGSLEQALELTAWLREASRATWAGDAGGIDVRAIESVDGRALELIREDGTLAELAIELPPDAAQVLLVQVELPADHDGEAALEAFAEGEARGPLGRLLAGLAARGVLDDSELALPGDPRGAQLLALREAVPVAVNHRVQAAQRDVDPRIHKVAGDMIVPFARMAEAFAAYREELAEARGLDLVIWGHISDGNVHPNVIARSAAEVEQGYEGLLACGRRLAALGGCPLSEHGVGRNPVKQALLRQLYGEAGLAAMRATKRALDPTGKLARDVVFPWVG